MQLSPGTRLGPYEILSPLGVGGMGEVYRARDTRLGRDVVIKTVPAAVAEDADGWLASSGKRGSSRRSTIPTWPLFTEWRKRKGAATSSSSSSTAKRSRIGSPAGRFPSMKRSMCVVKSPRDWRPPTRAESSTANLKPGNVMIAPDGRVKVLDFGLATNRGEHSRPYRGHPRDVTLQEIRFAADIKARPRLHQR
jgi:serine/threonine protein kinase